MSPSLSWIDPDRLKQSWARASTDVGQGTAQLDGDWVHFDAPRVDSKSPGLPPQPAQEYTQPPPTALPHVESHPPQATHVEAMPGPTAVPQTPPPPRRLFEEQIERELSFPSNETTAPLSSANAVRNQPPEPATHFSSRTPNTSSRSAQPTVSPETVSELAIEVATQMGSASPGGFDPLPPIGLSSLPKVVSPSLPDYGTERFIALRLPKFLQWFEQSTLPIAYYIADAHGLPVHLENMTETQAVAAVALTRSLRPLRRVIGSDRVDAVSLTLGDGRVTHTVWAETPLGRMALGLEASKSLSAEDLKDVGRALRTLFETGVSR